MKPLDNPECCFVCRRRADGLGVHRTRYVAGQDEPVTEVGWLCCICNDAGLGWHALERPDPDFDRIENDALTAAGNAVGAYLDGLGRTDLAALHPEEWRHACRLLIETFGHAMRREFSHG